MRCAGCQKWFGSRKGLSIHLSRCKAIWKFGGVRDEHGQIIMSAKVTFLSTPYDRGVFTKDDNKPLKKRTKSIECDRGKCYKCKKTKRGCACNCHRWSDMK